MGTEGELGLSARDISFPLLVWNRRRLSHGNERKLSKATNLCALRKPPPAALSAAGLTTLFLLHPQTPNIKFTLGLGIFFSCSTIPQISKAFFGFFFPLYLQIWKPVIKAVSLQSAAIALVSCFGFQSVLSQAKKKKKKLVWDGIRGEFARRCSTQLQPSGYVLYLHSQALL